MTNKRLQKEHINFQSDPLSFGSISPSHDNIRIWHGYIFGTSGTPYEGGKFHLTVIFPDAYPFRPPTITFQTPIFHTNIGTDGKVCLDILFNYRWKPIYDIKKLLTEIQYLLQEANTDDFLNKEAADLLRREKNTYDKTVREWTNKYAT